MVHHHVSYSIDRANSRLSRTLGPPAAPVVVLDVNIGPAACTQAPRLSKRRTAVTPFRERRRFKASWADSPGSVAAAAAAAMDDAICLPVVVVMDACVDVGRLV